MANPQQQPRDIERKDSSTNNPAKQAPSQNQGRDQRGQQGDQPKPENPADLGYDPKQPDTQARSEPNQNRPKDRR